MDIVYPVREGDNEELRYSLRSLRHIPHDRVWIVGGGPDWLAGINRIRRPQDRDKYPNTLDNIKAALQHPEVSDPFVLLCDDVFAMQPVDDISVLHCGPLADRIAAEPAGGYRQLMTAAQQLLHRLGYTDPLCYDLHTPIVLAKDRLRETLRLVGDEPMLWQTVHGNVHQLGGEYSTNVKVRSVVATGPDGPFISTNENTFAGGLVGQRIRAALPDPSPYETR